MGQGVEWALHVLLSLTWSTPGQPVPCGSLATAYGLPAPYLSKQLQPLVHAGLLVSVPGARGGFLLARPPTEISVMDVVTAIEGPEPAFRCAEIRQAGMGAELPRSSFATECAVAAAMRRADVVWRRALAAQSLADLAAEAEAHAPGYGAFVRDHHAR